MQNLFRLPTLVAFFLFGLASVASTFAQGTYATARLENLSVRTDLATATDSLTLGTVLVASDGAVSAPVLFRAAGPSLVLFDIVGSLSDPQLTVFNGEVETGANDDWAGAESLITAFNALGAFSFSATDSADAALYLPEAALGSTTMRVSGPNATGGNVLAELYLDTSGSISAADFPRPVNLSVLQNVDGLLIAGFVLSGNEPMTLLIRAVGPTLSNYGVSDPLSNPAVELFNSAGTSVASNLDWNSNDTLTSTSAAVGAFALETGSTDAAMLVNLTAGAYTVHATSEDSTQGTALIEVYQAPYLETIPTDTTPEPETENLTAYITQGLATTTIANLVPDGQRVSAVGTINSTDGKTWTVPAEVNFLTATLAHDLYNPLNNVSPNSLAEVDVNAVPIVEIDADGDVITGYIFADNYFELYVNGQLVAVDPVTFTPFNSNIVRFRAKSPITYAVKLVDWEENLGIGSEANGGSNYHAGDGGFIASFSDGTVTSSDWKAQTYYIAPLVTPTAVTVLSDGTRSTAGVTTTPSTDASSYGVHYEVPSSWATPTFDDSGWPAATSFTEATVGVDNKPSYTNFVSSFSGAGASFIWSSNLVLDNLVLLRFTTD